MARFGERLRVDPRPWIDSLAGGASDEDRAFAAEHGKMSRIDVSALPGYSGAVGQSLDAVRWMEQENMILPFSTRTRGVPQ